MKSKRKTLYASLHTGDCAVSGEHEICARKVLKKSGKTMIQLGGFTEIPTHIGIWDSIYGGNFICGCKIEYDAVPMESDSIRVNISFKQFAN